MGPGSDRGATARVTLSAKAPQAEYTLHGRPGVLRCVIFTAQMCEHHCAGAVGHSIPGQSAARFVGEVTMVAQNAAFQRIWVGAGRHPVWIVVALHHHQPGPRHPGADLIGDKAQVRDHGGLLFSTGDGIAHGLGRIMQGGERSPTSRLPRVKSPRGTGMEHILQGSDAVTAGGRCRDWHRPEAGTAWSRWRARDVVHVFMGDEHAGERFRLHPQGAERPTDAAAGDARINEDVLAPPESRMQFPEEPLARVVSVSKESLLCIRIYPAKDRRSASRSRGAPTHPVKKQNRGDQ